MRAFLVLLAWVSTLLPWQLCRAVCHERVAVGAHECHPGGRCPEKPGEEDPKAQDERIAFDSDRPSPAEPVVAPPAAAVPVIVVAAPAPLDAPQVADTRPPVPRTSVLLL